MKLSQFLWDRLWVAFGCDAYFALPHNLAFSQTQKKKLATCERHCTVVWQGVLQTRVINLKKFGVICFSLFWDLTLSKWHLINECFGAKLEIWAWEMSYIFEAVNMRKQNDWPQIMHLAFCSKAFWNFFLLKISVNPHLRAKIGSNMIISLIGTNTLILLFWGDLDDAVLTDCKVKESVMQFLPNSRKL